MSARCIYSHIPMYILLRDNKKTDDIATIMLDIYYNIAILAVGTY